MPPKKKSYEEPLNPLIHPHVDLDHVPLADRDYKIHETFCKFELFEMCYWLQEKYIDKSDDIGLWESKLPHYIFPHTHSAPEFIRKCQACYIPSQRAIISPTGEIIFTITAQSIDQMMQAPSVENGTLSPQKPLMNYIRSQIFSKGLKPLIFSQQEVLSCLRKKPSIFFLNIP